MSFRFGFLRTPAPRSQRWAAVLVLSALLGAAPGVPGARAGKSEPQPARSDLALVESAARAWAQDAVLVYVENDDDLGPSGAALRWGYLFHSSTRGQVRAWSVGEGHIVAAEDPGMKFDAPAVAAQWIDSEAALAAANEHGGGDYCREHSGRVSTMLLTRGVIETGSPDLTTWTVVYTSPGTPSLFVVLDAAQGRFCRTWRG
jgi:hypothetical protein